MLGNTDTNQRNVNTTRNALRDLGARFEISRYGDKTFAHMPFGCTVSFRSRFTNPEDRGALLTHVYVAPQRGQGFALSVAQVATVDLEVMRRA